MIKSMTGYGGAKGTVDGLELFVELRSVNNRYLDTNIRLPRNFMFAEEAVKSTVSDSISRGKVDVFITINSTKAENIIVNVNAPLAQGYLTALTNLAEQYGLTNNLSAMDIARFPDVLSVEKKRQTKRQLRLESVIFCEKHWKNFKRCGFGKERVCVMIFSVRLKPLKRWSIL